MARTPEPTKRSRHPEDPRGGFKGGKDFSTMRTLDGHVAPEHHLGDLSAAELSDTLDSLRNVHQYDEED